MVIPTFSKFDALKKIKHCMAKDDANRNFLTLRHIRNKIRI